MAFLYSQVRSGLLWTWSPFFWLLHGPFITLSIAYHHAFNIPGAIIGLVLQPQAIDIANLPKYQYESLNDSRRIRLLYLHPGRWADKVSCHLRQISIDERPPYEALSCCWGDPTQRELLQCGDGAEAVTIN
jgi:hypothetical protein